MLINLLYPIFIFQLLSINLGKSNKQKYTNYKESVSETIGENKTTSYELITIDCIKDFRKKRKIEVHLEIPKVLRTKNSKAKQRINRFLTQHYKVKNHKKIYKAPDLLISNYKKILEADPTFRKNWKFNFKENILYNGKLSLGIVFTSEAFSDQKKKFQQIRLFNLSPNTGNSLELNDFLYTNYHPKLRAIAEKIFRTNYKLKSNEDLIKAGFLFPNNVFELSHNYLFTKKGIIFYYNEGEINTVRKGSTSLEIPFNSIQHLVKTDWRTKE